MVEDWKYQERYREQRLQVFWDWDDFGFSFRIAKPQSWTGWSWFIDIQIAFFGTWCYFKKRR